jgi:hypothetical protein
MSRKYFHAWRVWEYEMPVDAEGWLEFCVRTWDSNLNVRIYGWQLARLIYTNVVDRRNLHMYEAHGK